MNDLCIIRTSPGVQYLLPLSTNSSTTILGFPQLNYQTTLTIQSKLANWRDPSLPPEEDDVALTMCIPCVCLPFTKTVRSNHTELEQRSEDEANRDDDRGS